MIHVLNHDAQKNRKQFVARLIIFSLLFSYIPHLHAMSVLRAAVTNARDMIFTKKFPLKKMRDRSGLTPAHRAQSNRLIYSILGYKDGHNPYVEFAGAENFFKLAPIAGKTEYTELHISWLIDQLDRARTSFGGWGLRELSFPHTNTDLIAQNQQIIKSFIADEKAYNALIPLLDDIYQREAYLLSYFDAQNILSARAHNMYFTFFLIPQSLRNRLNKSLTALELSTWIQMIKSGWSLAAYVGMSGIKSEFELMFHPLNKNPEFDLTRAVRNGFREIVSQHSPYFESNDRFHAVLNNPSVGEDVKKESRLQRFHEAFLSGNWGLRYRAIAEGIDYKWPIHVPFAPELSFSGEWKPINQVSLFTKFGAGVAATVPTLIYDYGYYKAVTSSYASLKETHLTMKDLRERCVRIKEFFQALRSISAVLDANVDFKRTHVGAAIVEQLKSLSSPNVDNLIFFLDTATFDGNDTFFYSRGRVLAAHTLLCKVTEELRAYLKALGQLDAYVSIATLMKEHGGKQAVFSFAQFEEGKTPALTFEGLWIPVLHSEAVVTNSFALGNDHSTKAVITGPNGGGKSTFLKALGQAVWLAQSWGIVPAAHGSLTMFTGIRSCLHAQEDLQRGMSTFMAEKARMDDIQEYLAAHASDQSKVLTLIDEPYRGTVDAESAERIDSFGKKALAWDHCAVVLATHVYPRDMMARFEGYHVEITEPQPGVFVRTFELKPGIAQWWFDDVARRARFVDWLGLQRSQHEKTADNDTIAIRKALAALLNADA